MGKTNPEPGHRVAYVFDSLADKQELQQFNDFVTDGFDLLEDGAVPDADPQVVYVFRAYRDQYELAEFQRGPKYGQALNTFGNWLRNMCRHPPDTLTEKEYDMVITIWEQWCSTLIEEGVASE